MAQQPLLAAVVVSAEMQQFALEAVVLAMVVAAWPSLVLAVLAAAPAHQAVGDAQAVVPRAVRPQLYVARALLECQPAIQHAKHTAAAGGSNGPMPLDPCCRQRLGRSPYRQGGRCTAVAQAAAANADQFGFQTAGGGYSGQSSAGASHHSDRQCRRRNRPPARGLIDRPVLRSQPAQHSRQLQAVEGRTRTYRGQQKPSHIRSRAIQALPRYRPAY